MVGVTSLVKCPCGQLKCPLCKDVCTVLYSEHSSNVLSFNHLR